MIDKAPTQTLKGFFTGPFWQEVLKDARRDSQTAHLRAMERFSSYLDREPVVDDLKAATCDGFEGWLAEQGCGTRGGLCSHSCIVRIWRHAYTAGLVDDGPRQKRRRTVAPAVAFLTKPTTRTGTIPTLLVDFAREYSLERGLSPRSAHMLRHHLSSFGKFLTRRPRLTDLRHDRINQWVVSMQDAGLAAETIRGRRIGIVALWRAAFEAEYVSDAPNRIRKVKVPQRLPTAWSQGELQRLLDAAAKTLGLFMLSRVSRPAFWRAWILTGYYTGLRRDDLLRLRFDDLRPDGRLFLVQTKTGNVVKCHLPDDAMQAIAATVPPARRLLFGNVLSPGRIAREFRGIVRGAKLQGSTKRLRATGATWCESVQPGSAPGFLGHRSPGLAYRSYVDPRHLQETKARPPRIGLPGSDAKDK